MRRDVRSREARLFMENEERRDAKAREAERKPSSLISFFLVPVAWQTREAREL